MRHTIKDLEKLLHTRDIELMNTRSRANGLDGELSQAKAKLESVGNENLRLIDEVAILRSDRDRLTAVVEVCTRRIASPEVESIGDIRRAGWRAQTQSRDMHSVGRGSH